MKLFIRNLIGGVTGAGIFLLLSFAIQQSGLLPLAQGEDQMNQRFLFFAIGYTLFVCTGCTLATQRRE